MPSKSTPTDGIDIYQGRWRALGVDDESNQGHSPWRTHTHAPTHPPSSFGLTLRQQPPFHLSRFAGQPVPIVPLPRNILRLARLRLSPVTARNLRPCTSTKGKRIRFQYKDTTQCQHTANTFFSFYYLSSFTKQHIPTSPTVTRFNFHTIVSNNGHAEHRTLVPLPTTHSIYRVPNILADPLGSTYHPFFSSVAPVNANLAESIAAGKSEFRIC